MLNGIKAGSRAGLVLAGALAGAIGAPSAALADEASVAVFEIVGTPLERSSGPAWLTSGELTLLDLIEQIDTAAIDDEFSGVVIRLKDSALAQTQVEELGRAMERVRAEGKQVHVFADFYGPSELLLGSFADTVIMQSGGVVSLPGMHMEEMYLADALGWIGVEAQLVQVGDYKGANEMMTRASPSPAWDENINGLLDGMYDNQRAMLMAGRELDDNGLDAAMRKLWLADGPTAIDAGVIDHEVDLPDLPGLLADAHGVDSVAWVADPYDEGNVTLDMTNPLMMLGEIMGEQDEPYVSGPSIAVLHVSGTIIDGDSSTGGPFGGGDSVGSRTVRNAIEDILEEDQILGVVVRIDSPGGSAIASEVMWQGLQRLRAEKPVWVSVGSMAASGGYYVLSAGERVYVNPSSIVGSIGVVGGKYAMGGLYDKLQIHVVERSRGPRAGLMSSTTPWDARELALVRTRMTETYELFTSRVAAGREGIDLSKTAEGRLFTGRQAIDLKMADRIGGLDDAINDLAAELGATNIDIVSYPPAPGFDELLGRLLGGFVQAPRMSGNAADLFASLRAVLGEQRFEAVRDSLNGMLLLRDEPVLLVSPRTVIIR